MHAPEELAERTAADRRTYLEDGLSDVSCRHCDGVVRVKKNSLAHTSIQWTAEAVSRCPAYSGRDSCPHLQREVSAALTRGELVIPGG